MQDRLEDFVKENRDAFDDRQPGDNVWQRIESSLDEEVKVKPINQGLWMWKAAVVLLLGAVAFLAVDRFVPRDAEVERISSIEEFEDLEAFYTSIISEKSSKLSVELEGEEFFNYLEADIEELDAIYDELRAAYTDAESKEAPNPEVLETLIHLLRQRLHLINSQLDILEEAKNPVKTREDETTAI